jgi:phosphonate metabolism protein PhnN/1,5-bisphosphokinase (PRPP-forming)
MSSNLGHDMSKEKVGQWVFVCGPSGAGKDSVMSWAASFMVAQTNIVFARRMVTRPVQPGSDHDAMTLPAFEALLHDGGLAWHWHAHGNRYGIAGHYARHVAQGGIVVVNGSREHVNTLPTPSNCRVVQIVAEARHLETRLVQRGRDDEREIAGRLARNAQFLDLAADCTIVNQGELADAGLQLADYLLSCAR